MKAILRFCIAILVKYCSAHVRSALTVFIALLIYTCSVAQTTTIKWIGDGSGVTNAAANSNFNDKVNWDLNRVPTSTDSAVLLLNDNNGHSINLTANTTVKNLTLLITSNNVQLDFNVASYSLKIISSSVIDIPYTQQLNRINFGVINSTTAAGIVDFGDSVKIGETLTPTGVFLVGNANSSFIFRGDVTLGISANVGAGTTAPGTILFDGTSTQKFIYNNSSAHTCSFNNITIGSTNNPSVVLQGTTIPDNILGNLTVNGSSTLDLNTRQLNRNNDGGSLFLKNIATLRLAALTSSANGGGTFPLTLNLVPGSNFPSGFTNIVLDSTSTVEFYGTTQSIPGAAHNIKGYGNLTLTNTTATNIIKPLISSFAMYRKLSIDANSTMALGAFNDTLKSNNQTTAYVGVLPSTAGITYGSGAFVIERYLQASKSWRLLATPVDIATSPTVSAAWRESNSLLSFTGYGTQITGPQGPRPTANAAAVLDTFTQRPSLKYYDPNTNDYIGVANANTTTIANTTGYYVFVRGDRGVTVLGAAGTTNLRIKGRIRRDMQTFPVLDNKYASIGNPYASKINFKTAIKNNLESYFVVWNPIAGYYGVGRFIQYSKDAKSGDYYYLGTLMNSIESGRAFFVKSLGSGSSLVINESDKLDGSYVVSRNQVSGRIEDATPSLQVTLKSSNSGSSEQILDYLKINFNEFYNNDFDENDVTKFMNADDNLSIKNGSRNLMVDSRKNLTSTDTIFLSLSNTRVAPYSFKIDPSVLSNLPLQSFLVDKFLQTETPVSLSEATNVKFSITADAASHATDRFMIIFKSVITAKFTAIKAVRNDDNSVAVTWNMANENNIKTYNIERSVDGTKTFTVINSQLPTANNFGNPYYTFTDADAPKGMVWYRITANTIFNNTFISDKASIEAIDINLKNGINIYPNLVSEAGVNLYFNNQAKGKYNIIIVNSNGEQIKFSTVEINNNAAMKNVQLKEVAAGMYRAIVKDEKGVSVVIPFVKL